MPPKRKAIEEEHQGSSKKQKDIDGKIVKKNTSTKANPAPVAKAQATKLPKPPASFVPSASSSTKTAKSTSKPVAAANTDKKRTKAPKAKPPPGPTEPETDADEAMEEPVSLSTIKIPIPPLLATLGDPKRLISHTDVVDYVKSVGKLGSKSSDLKVFMERQLGWVNADWNALREVIRDAAGPICGERTWKEVPDIERKSIAVKIKRELPDFKYFDSSVFKPTIMDYLRDRKRRIKERSKLHLERWIVRLGDGDAYQDDPTDGDPGMEIIEEDPAEMNLIDDGGVEEEYSLEDDVAEGTTRCGQDTFTAENNDSDGEDEKEPRVEDVAEEGDAEVALVEDAVMESWGDEELPETLAVVPKLKHVAKKIPEELKYEPKLSVTKDTAKSIKTASVVTAGVLEHGLGACDDDDGDEESENEFAKFQRWKKAEKARKQERAMKSAFLFPTSATTSKAPIEPAAPDDPSAHFTRPSGPKPTIPTKPENSSASTSSTATAKKATLTTATPAAEVKKARMTEAPPVPAKVANLPQGKTLPAPQGTVPTTAASAKPRNNPPASNVAATKLRTVARPDATQPTQPKPLTQGPSKRVDSALLPTGPPKETVTNPSKKSTTTQPTTKSATTKPATTKPAVLVKPTVAKPAVPAKLATVPAKPTAAPAKTASSSSSTSKSAQAPLRQLVPSAKPLTKDAKPPPASPDSDPLVPAGPAAEEATANNDSAAKKPKGRPRAKGKVTIPGTMRTTRAAQAQLEKGQEAEEAKEAAPVVKPEPINAPEVVGKTFEYHDE